VANRGNGRSPDGKYGRLLVSCRGQTRRSPRVQGEVGVVAPRGSLFTPRLAHPFGPPLPFGDPFGELGQVGAAAMQKGGLERLAWPPAVPLLAVTGSLAQRQVAGSATAGVLAGSCIALLRLPSHLLGGHSREIRPDCVALRLALFLSAFQHTQKRMAA